MKERLHGKARLGVGLLSALFFTICAAGQTTLPSMDLKNIVTPSPTASALGQYGNTPVGLYTGTSQVNVPLYEIREGALKLPVSLNCNTGGIKVAEIASWVGVGWSLNAGGSITRTVSGLPDENSIIDPYTISDHPTLGNIKDALLGRIDMQPDIFYFNFNGKTGKFFINKTNIVTISPHQNLKIQAFQGNNPVDPPFTSISYPLQFRVTDEDGIVYEFRDFEKNRTLTFDALTNSSPFINQPGNPPASVTAWYLTRMFNPSGDTIKFVYTDYSLSYDLSSSEQRYILANPGSGLLVPEAHGSTMVNVTMCQNQNKRLPQILFSSGSIRLTANTPRIDLLGDTMLNQLSILDKDGKLVKGYKFNYKYENGVDASQASAGATDNNTYDGYASNTSMTSFRRLLLTGLSELDSSGAATGRNYAFDYYPYVSYAPSRFSKARDHWGYANGATMNESTILNYQQTGTDINNPSNYMVLGKDPSLNECRQYSISKITYPTGGYTQFNYELHNAFVGKGVLPPELVNQVVSMPIDYSSYDMQGYTDTLINGVHCKYKTFTINVGGGTYVNMEADNMIYQSPGLVTKYDIYSLNNQPFMLYKDFRDDPGTTMTINNTTLAVSYSNRYFFPAGAYKIIFTPYTSYIGSTAYHDTYGYNPLLRLSGWSNMVYHTDTILIHRSIGGLRTASTIDYDPVTDKYLRKDYKYTLPGDSMSSGAIVSGVTYAYNHTDLCLGVQNTNGGSTLLTALYGYVVLNSESQYPLSTTQGSNVGYSMVTVTESDAVSGMPNGRSDYTYTSPKDYPDYYGLLPSYLYYQYNQAPSGSNSATPGPANVYPYAPADSRDWERGLLLKKVDYKFGNEQYAPVRSENYNYDNPVYIDTVIGIQARYHRQAFPGVSDTITTYGGVSSPYPEIYAIKPYGLTAGYVLLRSKTTTTYGDNGQALIDTQFYQYANVPANMLPSQVGKSNSKGELDVMDMKYPTNYNISGTPVTAQAQGIVNLQQRHILSPVIEQISKVTNGDGSNVRTLGAVYTTYKSGLPLPDSIFRLEVSQPLTSFSPVVVAAGGTTMDVNYKPRLAFTTYDSRGNLLQQKKISDKTHSYIWDYKGIYPIAEVVNAVQTEVAYTSFEADGTGNWSIGSASRNTSGAMTGGRWYSLNSDVSKSGLTSSNAYIVSYWTKNFASFTITGTMAGYPVKGRTINGWTFYLHKITGQTGITINGVGSIDEVRLYPASAVMTSYTFQPLIGMTSQCDATGKITYYEYDGLQRLLRVRDMDGNIVKQFEYRYQSSTRCGGSCYVLSMTNLAGAGTLSYPVGVFNANGKLLDTASNQARFITVWNADTANANRGTLSAGGDSLHFQLALNAGKALPAITGCRYFKVDLAWNQIDGIRNINGCYVDFGDGASVRLAANPGDIITPLPANTIQKGSSALYLVHTYADTTLKTLTFYHNDGEETQYIDNVDRPATSVSKLKNLRGNLPQHIKQFGSSSNQQTTMSSVANITNWSSIHSINDFHLNTGDGGTTTIQNLSYQQDFMAGNPDLQSIQLARNNLACYFDATFKISRLKSDWNTWFKHLQFLSLTDAQWSREDLSGLKELNYFYIIPARPLYSNDPSGNTEIPIPQSVVDGIFNQIAAGSGQTVSGGFLYVSSAGSGRSSASNTAVNTLLAKGWALYLDGQQLH